MAQRNARPFRTLSAPIPAEDIEPLPRWTRRSFIAATAAATLAAACSDRRADEAPVDGTAAERAALGSAGPAASTTPPPPDSGASAATVEVTDVLGTRHLPASPRRVACLDGRADLELAALCGFPVAAFYDRSTPTVPLPDGLAAATEGATKLPFDPNLEQLAELSPDLIIAGDTYWFDELGRDRFETIAPVLVAMHLPESGQWDWRSEFSCSLEAFGRADRLAEHLDRYDAAVARIRERWAATIDATQLSLLQYNSGTDEIVLHPPTQIMLGQVVSEVGGAFAPVQRRLTEPLILGAERLEDADADLIVRSAFELTDDAFAGLESSPLWGTLDAVRRGAVVDTAVLVVNFGGPTIALECAHLVDRIYEHAATTI